MRRKRSRTATAIFFSLLAAIPAFSGITDWKTVGWWDISFYSSAGGCSASTQYDSGTSFFIGLSGNDEITLDVTIANDGWGSLEDGKEYSISVAFGNETPWNLEMKGSVSENFHALSLSVKADSDQAGRFVDEFMRETKMQWTYEGNSLGVLMLNGSRQAFQEVVACTKSYRDATQGVTDPFAGSTTSRDPFQ